MLVQFQQRGMVGRQVLKVGKTIATSFVERDNIKSIKASCDWNCTPNQLLKMTVRNRRIIGMSVDWNSMIGWTTIPYIIWYHNSVGRAAKSLNGIRFQPTTTDSKADAPILFMSVNRCWKSYKQSNSSAWNLRKTDSKLSIGVKNKSPKLKMFDRYNDNRYIYITPVLTVWVELENRHIKSILFVSHKRLCILG